MNAVIKDVVVLICDDLTGNLLSNSTWIVYHSAVPIWNDYPHMDRSGPMGAAIPRRCMHQGVDTILADLHFDDNINSRPGLLLFPHVVGIGTRAGGGLLYDKYVMDFLVLRPQQSIDDRIPPMSLMYYMKRIRDTEDA